MKTLYLSGKIKNLPRWWVILKFYFWHFILKMRGYKVWNPVREVFFMKISDEEKLRRCLENLPDQEYIFFISGWKSSPGARWEFDKACIRGLKLVNKDRETNFLYKANSLMFKAIGDEELFGIDKLLGL